jgi:hypothetical protein
MSTNGFVGASTDPTLSEPIRVIPERRRSRLCLCRLKVGRCSSARAEGVQTPFTWHSLQSMGASVDEAEV